MRGIIVFVIAIPLVMYLFNECGVKIAVDELRWASAVGGAVIVVFALEFCINFLSIPARREGSLKARIDELHPGDLILTECETAILMACRKADRTSEHWLSKDTAICRLDGEPISSESGAEFAGSYVHASLASLEGLGLVRVISCNGGGGVNLMLTASGCEVLRKLLARALADTRGDRNCEGDQDVVPS